MRGDPDLIRGPSKGVHTKYTYRLPGNEPFATHQVDGYIHHFAAAA